MSKIAIIGGGFTGLTTAYQLSKLNHQVSLFEKNNYLGGLASGFKQKNHAWPLENFFHHLFASDLAAKKLISELGLKKNLFFKQPKTSLFFKNKIYQFDSLFSIFAFPYFNWREKIRFGLITLFLKITPYWQPLEKMTSQKWLKKYYGQKVYQIIWQPLLESKFGKQANKISMAWFWARIKKRSFKLGYLKGGFQVLIDKLAEKIKKNNGQIFLNHKIKDFKSLKNFDKIIDTRSRGAILGAVNLVLVLKEKFLKDTYWLNINEKNFPFVAVVEHTNFISPQHYAGEHILYVGGYYPQNHRYFKMKKEAIFQEFLPYLQKINPNFKPLNTKYLILNTNLYAQPIIPVNYSQIIPHFKTSLPHVYQANMQMVYPYDRGVNYAIEMGNQIAKIICDEKDN